MWWWQQLWFPLKVQFCYPGRAQRHSDFLQGWLRTGKRQGFLESNKSHHWCPLLGIPALRHMGNSCWLQASSFKDEIRNAVPHHLSSAITAFMASGHPSAALKQAKSSFKLNYFFVLFFFFYYIFSFKLNYFMKYFFVSKEAGSARPYPSCSMAKYFKTKLHHPWFSRSYSLIDLACLPHTAQVCPGMYRSCSSGASWFCT